MFLAPGFDVATGFLYKVQVANQLFGKTPNLGCLFRNLVVLQGESFVLFSEQMTRFSSTLHCSLGKTKIQQMTGKYLSSQAQISSLLEKQRKRLRVTMTSFGYDRKMQN